MSDEVARLRAALGASEARVEALERELAERAARLAETERASESKTRFVSHVSHEFRTPLGSILGYTSLLADDGARLSAARRREYLEIVLRNARHLLHVVNDLLNLSKVEAGALEVTLAPVAAAGVAAAVVSALRPLAEERGIEVAVAGGERLLALADTGRLRQVLLNLLENAIKYSPSGSRVEVRVRRSGAEVRVEVEDAGPGIGEEDQALLFKEFSRIPHAHTGRVAGAGLGLALSKRLVELMGGRIGVESAWGRGSSFWVALPAAHADDGAWESGAGAAAPPPRPRTETVAVVDDDRDIRQLAAAILEFAGYLAVRDDGEPGLAERLAAVGPALVLLDLNLATRSGAEALAEIRGHAALRAVPVVAFTAAPDEAQRLGPLGFLDHLVKPFEPEALVERVDAVLNGVSPAPADADAEEDDDYLAPLRARFRSGLGERLAAMERALATADGEALTREVHKLRGAAAGFGMPHLAALAADAEEALRRNPSSQARATRALFDALRREAADG